MSNDQQQQQELLPPAASDCASAVRLIKPKHEAENSFINRPDESTYLDQKSVLRSEATPRRT
jgi:hypothetical protein